MHPPPSASITYGGAHSLENVLAVLVTPASIGKFFEFFEGLAHGFGGEPQGDDEAEDCDTREEPGRVGNSPGLDHDGEDGDAEDGADAAHRAGKANARGAQARGEEFVGVDHVENAGAEVGQEDRDGQEDGQSGQSGVLGQSQGCEHDDHTDEAPDDLLATPVAFHRVHADCGAGHAQEGDHGGADVGQDGRALGEGLEDRRGVHLDAVEGDGESEPEGAAEDRGAHHLGGEEFPPRAFGGVGGGGVGVEVGAVLCGESGHDLVGFFDAAAGAQPARGFGDVGSQQEDDTGNNGADEEHPAPGVGAQREHEDTGDVGGECAGLPHEGHEDDEAATLVGRGEFGGDRRGDRVVGADEQAEEESGGNQLPHVLGECCQEREDDKSGQVDDVGGAATQGIGQFAAEEHAEEHADNGGGGDDSFDEGALDSPGCFEAGQGDGDDGDIETVQEHTGSGQECDAALEAPSGVGIHR